MSERQTVVERFVQAIISGQMDVACAMLSPDIVVRHATRLPYGGVYHGRDGFAEMVQKIGAYWETFGSPGSNQFLEHDGVVVCLGNIVGRPRHLDGELRIPVMERYTVEAGSITRIDPYYVDWDLTEEQLG